MISDIPTPLKVVTNYLKSRAIPVNDISMRKYGLEIAGAERISEILNRPPRREECGLAIHYPGTDYSTVRVMGGGPICPKASTPHAYLSPDIDWATVSGRLVLCESPLKAITWTRAGVPALAAGGVDTIYMGSKKEWCVGFPHAAIENSSIDRVTVAWDSDTEGDNHNVSRAMRVLCHQLRTLYPDLLIDVQVLPKPPEDFGKKNWGVDDARNYYGEEWFNEWKDSPDFCRVPEQDAVQLKLDYLNDTYAVVESIGKVVHIDRGTTHSATDFKTILEGPCRARVDDKMVAIPPLWLTWEGASRVPQMVYQPNGDKIERGQYYNLWKPSKLRPQSSDVSPFLDMLRNNIRDEETYELLLDCLAYQVQYRGEAKLEKMLFFCGRHVGTGKSTIFNIMKRILGSTNVAVITKQDFESQYNSSWSTKEIACLDDCAPMNKDAWAKMKALITADEILVTEKYMPAQTMRSHTVFYATANQADVIKFDPEERRILVIEFDPRVNHRGEDAPAYWTPFYKWLEDKGYAAIAQYLLKRDLTQFDPNFRPPMSQVKKDAMEAQVSDEESFLADFVDDPFNFLPEGRKFIYSTELYMLFRGGPATFRDSGDLQGFMRQVFAKRYLHRASEKRMKVGKDKVWGLWVPGEEDDSEPAPRDIRKNINEYEIKIVDSE